MLSGKKIMANSCVICTLDSQSVRVKFLMGFVRARELYFNQIGQFFFYQCNIVYLPFITWSCSWIYSTLPENKQMLALSATYPEYLAQHLTGYMRNPTFLRLNVTDPALLGQSTVLFQSLQLFSILHFVSVSLNFHQFMILLHALKLKANCI